MSTARPVHDARHTCAALLVDILSRLNGKGAADARAFAGIAYRITPGGDRFEAVYLRPLNGWKTNPPSPRDQRAVQYFAYPDWKFDRLRERVPRWALRSERGDRPRRMDQPQDRDRRHPSNSCRQPNRGADVN